jgi:hypothetical protein
VLKSRILWRGSGVRSDGSMAKAPKLIRLLFIISWRRRAEAKQPTREAVRKAANPSYPLSRDWFEFVLTCRTLSLSLCKVIHARRAIQ